MGPRVRLLRGDTYKVKSPVLAVPCKKRKKFNPFKKVWCPRKKKKKSASLSSTPICKLFYTFVEGDV